LEVVKWDEMKGCILWIERSKYRDESFGLLIETANIFML